MENRKKFKSDKPDKKDHFGLKTAGKVLKGFAGAAAGAVVFVLNKDRLKNGLDIAKTIIKK